MDTSFVISLGGVFTGNRVWACRLEGKNDLNRFEICNTMSSFPQTLATSGHNYYRCVNKCREGGDCLLH